jgi:glycosyltransferase involved in cell wall biosynthesis
LQKLLYITTNLNDSGGVSRILSVKLNAFVKDFGYNVCVVNTKGGLSSMFYHFDKKIQMVSLPKSKSNIINIVTYRKKLNRAINNFSPDIIVNCDNGFKSSLLPYLIKSKTPLIYERHCSRNIKSRTLIGSLKFRLSNWFLDLSIRKYNYVVVLSDYAKLEWSYNNIKVISNPLWFKQPLVESDLSSNVVVAVGRIAYEKGYENLLEIWKIVNEKYTDWILKIYGEGDSSQLKKLTKALDIQNNVQFFEPIKDIKDIYLNASMLLNTSSSEAFGLTIIEAMSYGLPVISFENTLGAKQNIVNSNNGFLIEENNLTAYATKISSLIESKQEMKRVSKNARESLKNYDFNLIMMQWHDLFQSLK